MRCTTALVNHVPVRIKVEIIPISIFHYLDLDNRLYLHRLSLLLRCRKKLLDACIRRKAYLIEMMINLVFRIFWIDCCESFTTKKMHL